MIATLRGKVLERGSGRIVIDVGGVGYLLAATSAAIRMAVPDGEEVTLVTHLHVREDALILFGFASTAERDLFELLLGVSGVGPKAALAIVSGYAPDQIRRAIVTSDHALFTSITGVGRKTAERVVIDLKDKVGSLPATPAQDVADVAAGRRPHRGPRRAGRPRHVRGGGRGGAAQHRCRPAGG